METQTQTDSREFKIEKLEIDAEETRHEISLIETTIKNVDEIKRECPSRSIKNNIEIFLTTLKQEKENNEQILQEITDGIEFVKTR